MAVAKGDLMSSGVARVGFLLLALEHRQTAAKFDRDVLKFGHPLHDLLGLPLDQVGITKRDHLSGRKNLAFPDQLLRLRPRKKRAKRQRVRRIRIVSIGSYAGILRNIDPNGIGVPKSK